MANPSGKVFEVVIRPVAGTVTVKTPEGYFDALNGEYLGGRKPTPG